MPRSRFIHAAFLCLLGAALIGVAAAPMLAGAQTAAGAHDTGVRAGASAGGPISGLTANQLAFFKNGRTRFNDVDSVSGKIAGEGGSGLGPRFNMNSCAGCHAQPAAGGTSPFGNPQVAVATLDGATNQVPYFVTTDGPVREARFVHNPDGSPDGGVHDLFTIAGRSDAPGCTTAQIQQPNFEAQGLAGNIIFRIPTPVFGGGLISAIPDVAIVRNKDSDLSRKVLLGIAGHENREGNAGTITRFGWKAQNKSLQIFAGEAYLVEMGVTNELFTQERGEPGDRGYHARVEPSAACLFNGTPEDSTNFDQITVTDTQSDIVTGTPSDVVGFSLFMEFSAPPQPSCIVGQTCSPSINDGATQFHSVGCDVCHTPSLKTGRSSVDALSNKPARLFSDLLVHRMGSGLADGVSQGNASGEEFRTAPLWGLGQRIFFLHDGRTHDLLQAIEDHDSPGSEADAVIDTFNGLTASQQQDVLNFLRSL